MGAPAAPSLVASSPVTQHRVLAPPQHLPNSSVQPVSGPTPAYSPPAPLTTSYAASHSPYPGTRTLAASPSYPSLRPSYSVPSLGTQSFPGYSGGFGGMYY